MSITTRIPIFLSSLTALGLSSLMTSATAIMPRSFPSRAKKRGVLPSPDSLSAISLMPGDISAFVFMKLRLPANISFPFTVPLRPFPGKALKMDTSSQMIFLLSAYEITAFASGCSLFFSRDAAALRSSFSVISPFGIMSVTLGSPFVIVPVLSSATICILPVSSRDAAVLKRIPFFAPRPLPTIIATGVARPKAHGHDITRTEIPRASA